MANELTKLTSDLEYTVDCLRPLLKELYENQGTPIFLSSLPCFEKLNGADNWVITILKSNMDGVASMFIYQHNENHKRICYIVLSEELFKDSKKMKERKKVILVHEFCHFLALFFASFNTKDKILSQRIKEKFYETEKKLANPQVMQLLQILDKSKLIDDFDSYVQANDEHFRIGTEKWSLNYADLYKNLLLSRQLFDEYFTREKREVFFKLFGTEKSNEAEKLLIDAMDEIAEDESLPKSFVISQTNDIIMKYYLKEFKQ